MVVWLALQFNTRLGQKKLLEICYIIRMVVLDALRSQRSMGRMIELQDSGHKVLLLGI